MSARASVSVSVSVSVRCWFLRAIKAFKIVGGWVRARWEGRVGGGCGRGSVFLSSEERGKGRGGGKKSVVRRRGCWVRGSVARG